jgi:hypothetical protein
MVASTISSLSWAAQHIKNGHIKIERAKGSNNVDIPVSAELAAAIAAMPETNLTFVTTLDGSRPRTLSNLTSEFRGWVAAAGLPAHCRLYGLKKGAMRRLAEDNATAHELMAISGTLSKASPDGKRWL